MKIVIAGASGFIGRPLTAALQRGGHQVIRLVRTTERADHTIFWNPSERNLASAALEGVDAVINLAGENIAGGRWSAERRERIMRSRVDATGTLVAAFARLQRKPAVFLSASAAGYYGDRGDEALTEGSGIGQGFLSEVCLAWETHAEQAAKLGIRTALLRFGVVLAADGGALAKMLPLFRLGLGGPLGSGEQWMSWISRDDVLGAIEHALTHDRCAGPLNLVAPNPVTNADFTRILARALRRPAILPAPVWALRLAFGQMADEALLASQRVIPERLTGSGYAFRHPALPDALSAALDR